MTLIDFGVNRSMVRGHMCRTTFLVIINPYLILPTPKVISLCHQFRAKSACTFMQSDQALYCWVTSFKFSS